MEDRAAEIAVSLKGRDDVEAAKPRLEAAVGPGFELSTSKVRW